MSVNTLESVSSLSNMGILNNEILSCTIKYNHSDPYFGIYLGKRVQQNNNCYWHNQDWGKWSYAKTYNYWYHMNTALHNNLPNESFVELNGSSAINANLQLWAYIKRYNG